MVEVVTASAMDRLLASYESYLRVERMRGASTLKRYLTELQDFSRFLSELAPELPLEAVTKAHLVSFLRSGTATEEPSRSLWNMRLSALRSFYDYLFKTELITVNPALKIDRLKVRSREPVPLNLDEFIALVEAMETLSGRYRWRNVALAQVLFHCAFRVSEVLSLDLHQVDFDAYLFTNVRTKGGKMLSQPFNDVVAEALEQYLSDRPSLASGTDCSALFLSDRGKRLSVRAAQEMLRTYGLAAGINRPVTPHLLRHSSATELHDLGAPLRVVQDICNHSSVTTTVRYVHVKGGAQRQAIDALGVRVARLRRAARRARRPARPARDGHDEAPIGENGGPLTGRVK